MHKSQSTVWTVNVVQVETNQVETNRLVSTLAWLVSTQCGNQPEKGGNRPVGFRLLPGWFPPLDIFKVIMGLVAINCTFFGMVWRIIKLLLSPLNPSWSAVYGMMWRWFNILKVPVKVMPYPLWQFFDLEFWLSSALQPSKVETTTVPLLKNLRAE